MEGLRFRVQGLGGLCKVLHRGLQTELLTNGISKTQISSVSQVAVF